MDRYDTSGLARPDQEWQQEVHQALLDSPTLADRYARGLLTELVGDMLGRHISLREQATPALQLLELVRFCVREEGGLPALAYAVSALEGHSRTSDRVSELVREHITAAHVPEKPQEAPRQAAREASQPPAPADLQLPDRTLDFFVSYTGADRAWAAWIAWELEAAGYGVLVQEWDFVPGSNWPVGMERGVTECERTVAVLSPAYLTSVYGRQEWQAVQAADPVGLARKLLPVRVAPCRPNGLLSSLVYLDLVDLPKEDARRRLLDGVAAARTGRSKPALPPRFPG
ncbi:toll/interleukin-1 receptor domain-containing protein [Streptomyces sp. NPDC001401]|uniref:toll/interleukin-1 receptor domain-containing protein n=1 Tax=Streptomyces sp. NPDC001401 TaxID=3364570 RepID=UPI0036C31625